MFDGDVGILQYISKSQPAEKKKTLPSACQVMQARYEAMKEAKLKQKNQVSLL